MSDGDKDIPEFNFSARDPKAAGETAAKLIEEMQNNNSKEVQISAILIGDAGTGKSALVARFAEGECTDPPRLTIGIDFSIAKFKLNGLEMRFQLWDTAGQEKYRAITTSYYRRAMGVVLVYDVTKEKTFLNLSKFWIETAKEFAHPDSVWLLLGNKVDLEDWRQVSTERGEKLARQLGCSFFEVSARENQGVYESFVSFAGDILNDSYPRWIQAHGLSTSTRKLDERENGTPERKCCSGT